MRTHLRRYPRSPLSRKPESRYHCNPKCLDRAAGRIMAVTVVTGVPGEASDRYARRMDNRTSAQFSDDTLSSTQLPSPFLWHGATASPAHAVSVHDAAHDGKIHRAQARSFSSGRGFRIGLLRNADT